MTVALTIVHTIRLMYNKLPNILAIKADVSDIITNDVAELLEAAP